MIQKKDHNVSDGPKTLKTYLLIHLLAQDDRWTVVEVPNTIMLKYQPISKILVRLIWVPQFKVNFNYIVLRAQTELCDQI